MNTILVNKEMDGIPGFCGTFACDMIPTITSNISLIINTDPSSKPGKHWIAVYTSINTFYFFDSFGRSIEQFAEPFRSYMRQASAGFNVRTSSHNLQFILSDTCGYWCIFWIYCKFSGVKILEFFSKDNFQNEIILKDIMYYLTNKLPRSLLDHFKNANVI